MSTEDTPTGESAPSDGLPTSVASESPESTAMSGGAPHEGTAEAADAHGGPAQSAAEPALTIGGAVAHLVGVSRPQDEYQRADDHNAHLDDETLRALGVESDPAPSDLLVGTFAALIVGLIATGVVVVALFNIEIQRQRAAVAGERDPAFVEAEGSAAAVLAEYSQVERPDAPAGSPAGYRVPVEVGMTILLERQQLLERHPFGHRNPADIAPPPNAPPPPPPVALDPFGGSGLGLVPEGGLQLTPPVGIEPMGSPTLQLSPPGTH